LISKKSARRLSTREFGDKHYFLIITASYKLNSFNIVRMISKSYFGAVARKIERSLRNDFFAHLQSFNFDFFSEKKVGDLMAHTVNDVETLKFACGLGVLVAYDGIFLLVFIFGTMLYIYCLSLLCMLSYPFPY